MREALNKILAASNVVTNGRLEVNKWLEQPSDIIECLNFPSDSTWTTQLAPSFVGFFPLSNDFSPIKKAKHVFKRDDEERNAKAQRTEEKIFSIFTILSALQALKEDFGDTDFSRTLPSWYKTKNNYACRYLWS